MIKLLKSQQEFLLNENKYCALFGGIGSGKTYIGTFWFLLKALKNPHCLGFVGANTYHQLYHTTLRTLINHLDNFKIHYHINYNFGFMYIRTSKIIFKSLQNYEDIRGIEIGYFYIDETRDTKKEAWQVLQGRLRSSVVNGGLRGRITTSVNGFDWLYEEFVLKEYLDHSFVITKTQDNPYLPEDYIESLKKSYDERYAKQELEAQFISVNTGQVYYNFDRQKNVRNDIDYQPNLPVWWCIDFNVNPISTCLVQVYQDTIFVFDELVINESSTQELCQAFKQRFDFINPEKVIVYPDPSGKARKTSAGIGVTDFTILMDNGFKIIRAKNIAPEIKDRINSVCAKIKNSNGQNNLFISNKCKNVIMSFEKTSYKENTNLVDKSGNCEHITDALGYMIDYEFPMIKLRPADIYNFWDRTDYKKEVQFSTNKNRLDKIFK